MALLSRIVSRVQRLTLVILTLLATIGCDQATKQIAIGTLKGTPPQVYLGGFFRLEYIENPGAFLGLGGAASDSLRFWILTVVVGAAMVWVIVNLFRKTMPLGTVIALSLLAGGGVSNLLDRMFRTEGRVVDFLNVGIGPVRTGIFNVADVAIMIGVAMLLIASVTWEKRANAKV